MEDGKYYNYPTMAETLALLKSKNIKFVGICQPGCDFYQMNYLVSKTKGLWVRAGSDELLGHLPARTIQLATSSS